MKSFLTLIQIVLIAVIGSISAQGPSETVNAVLDTIYDSIDSLDTAANTIRNGPFGADANLINQVLAAKTTAQDARNQLANASIDKYTTNPAAFEKVQNATNVLLSSANKLITDLNNTASTAANINNTVTGCSLFAIHLKTAVVAYCA